MEDFLRLTGNYFFPLVLSCFLIYRLDNFYNKLVSEMKVIANTQTKILFYLQTGFKSKIQDYPETPEN